MNDSGLVSRHEPGDDRADDRQRSDDVERAFVAEERRQIGTIDVRHRDVLDAGDFSKVVNANDVLVSDLSRQLQLALEASFDLACGKRIGHHLRTNHLDGHRFAEFCVPRLIHGAHSADAEGLDDEVAGTK